MIVARPQYRYPRPIPRFEVMAPIVSHERAGHEAEIVFHAPDVATVAQPGQFLEILFGENYAPLVRRPFSLYHVDRAAGTVSILYIARGSFTSSLAAKRAGDPVSLLGPLGNPFSWVPEPETRYLLIAGGRGAPPITFLARALCADLALHNLDTQQIVVLNAARSKEYLVAMDDFRALPLTLHSVTQDGSEGQPGMVTDALRPLLADNPAGALRIFACGPMPMLRAVGDIAIEQGISCQLSIETSMPCGIGTCLGCAVPVRDSSAPDGIAYALACWDGPVFEAADLLWEML
jgi:dihydroorotate dehydrogenase electron transfer subunit